MDTIQRRLAELEALESSDTGGLCRVGIYYPITRTIDRVMAMQTVGD